MRNFAVPDVVRQGSSAERFVPHHEQQADCAIRQLMLGPASIQQTQRDVAMIDEEIPPLASWAATQKPIVEHGEPRPRVATALPA
jgi:hypothetical protein